MRRAIVAGGTGLVGGQLLRELSRRGVPTRAVARRQGTSLDGVDWLVKDLAALTPADVPAGTDAAFCCLGTTIRDAGSQEGFRRVDHDLVLAFANACRAAGVPQLHVVSAAGADASSRIFYSRVKGEAERDLQALGFPTLGLYRPSLLDGERAQRRTGERVGLVVARALRPLLPAGMRPVPAAAVARAMLAGALAAEPGAVVVPSKRIALLGA